MNDPFQGYADQGYADQGYADQGYVDQGYVDQEGQDYGEDPGQESESESETEGKGADIEEKEESDMLEYSYISPDIYTNAPCPEGADAIPISLYIYAISHSFIEGVRPLAADMTPFLTSATSATSSPQFLPKYNAYYPFLKIKAMVNGRSLSFPKIEEYECITRSLAGDVRFRNECIEALKDAIPEWGEYLESNPARLSTIFCGLVANQDGSITAVMNATELQEIPSPSMPWFLLDELIYSPDKWTPSPDILSLFHSHTSMRHIWVRGDSGDLTIGPTPLCVYPIVPAPGTAEEYADAEMPPLLPAFHPTWGWVYSYTPAPLSSTSAADSALENRHMGFMVHVLYAIEDRSYEKEWGKVGILFQRINGKTMWRSRRPFSTY